MALMNYLYGETYFEDPEKTDYYEFTNGDYVGCGGFGQVYKAKYKKTGEYYALKFFNKKDIEGNKCNKENEATDDKKKTDLDDKNKLILKELKACNEMREKFKENPYITKIIDIMETKESFVLIAELGDITLHEKITNHKKETGKGFEKIKALRITYEIALALKNLDNFAHRDLKPMNIVFKKNCRNKDVQNNDNKNMGNKDFQNSDNENSEIHEQLKLIDFGSAKDNQHLQTAFEVGTDRYKAPEYFDYQKDSKNIQKFSPKVDIWSQGIILYEMLTSEPPFTSSKANNQIDEYAKNKENRNCIYDKEDVFDDKDEDGPKIIDFLKEQLECDVNKRLDIGEVQAHEIFKFNKIVSL